MPAEEYGARADLGYEDGDEIAMFYDPLIGKVIVARADRHEAIAAMRSFVDAVVIDGIKTNVPALKEALDTEAFRSGDYDTGLLGK